MKIKNIEDWEAFLAVCNENSFIRAAKRLNLSAAVVTKRIARLESQLETLLFHRTTRSISLTRDGEELFPVAERLLADIKEAELYFEGAKKLSGSVKMTAPVSYGQRHLVPILTAFLSRYPDIEIELILTGSVLNMVEEGIDLAVRGGPLDDSMLIAQKIGKNQLFACASSEYLKKSRRIAKPQDLKEHSLLFLDVHENQRFLQTRDKLLDLASKPRIHCNDGAAITLLAVSGAGVAVRSSWDVTPYLKSGKLVRILPEFPIESPGDLFVVTHSRRFPNPRVRALREFIVNSKKIE